MQNRLIVHGRVIGVFGILAVTACGNTQPGTTSVTPATPTGTVTDADGNVYPTIRIGRQEWMVENLKTTKYSDGTAIPQVTDASAWANSTSAAYCWYDNDPANKDIYGALYNWYTVQAGKLCPTGWYVPSNDNWDVLATNLGSKTASGGKLKEAGTAHWQSPNSGATNESGFSALPGGSRYLNGAFMGMGQRAVWWSTDEDNSAIPPASWFWDVNYDSTTSGGATSYWVVGYSVRCMRGLT